VSLDRKAGKRTEIQESFARYDPQRAAAARPSRCQAMVRIMLGCDKFCTYCIVPSVRGPEQSRPAEEIEAEVRQLVDQGCLEVTLLGQTVNSYQTVSGGRTVRLSDLLARLDAVAGLRRLKFVTNYPRHMTRDLLEAVRDLKRVSPYLHVPAQSGSDRVLQQMKRGYTAGQYRRMHDEIRQVVPHAAVTSDFIVGFCGETEDDFQATVRLLQDLRFKNSFIFKYSARPGTKAAELLADDVPEEVKRRRNNELLSIQNAISHEDSLPLIGQTLEILVEGPSKTSLKRAEEGPVVQLTGRDACDRIVVFDGPRELVGRIVPVEITEANPFTLFGRLG
jgi:tRNA-2-methylthio-N6-dimethylallyladenosine synthase